MLIEISNGELVDKVSILSIKLKKITDPEKIRNVQAEYNLLFPKMVQIGIDAESKEYLELLEINQKLWEIEDQIRKKEACKTFDRDFIQLARNVYIFNDTRADIKRRINASTKSELMEEKEYCTY